MNRRDVHTGRPQLRERIEQDVQALLGAQGGGGDHDDAVRRQAERPAGHGPGRRLGLPRGNAQLHEAHLLGGQSLDIDEPPAIGFGDAQDNGGERPDQPAIGETPRGRQGTPQTMLMGDHRHAGKAADHDRGEIRSELVAVQDVDALGAAGGGRP